MLNNAGISGKGGQMEWLTLENYQETFRVNVLGTIDVSMTFLPLVKAERGRVVITSSAGGRHITPSHIAYSMSKHGIEAFGDALRFAIVVRRCADDRL